MHTTHTNTYTHTLLKVASYDHWEPCQWDDTVNEDMLVYIFQTLTRSLARSLICVCALEALLVGHILCRRVCVLCLHVCEYVCVRACLPVCLPSCLSIYLSVLLSINLSACLLYFLSISCLSVCLYAKTLKRHKSTVWPRTIACPIFAGIFPAKRDLQRMRRR